MDGNGRWARQRNLPRMAGHRAGVENIRCILREAARLGVQYVTLYAFSTENWSRPPDEVDGLMELLSEFIDREATELHSENVRIRHLGSTDQLASALVSKIRDAVELTRANSGITVAVALNYGGRQEIVQALRSLVEERIPASEVTERRIGERLTTAGMPDPDLIIRTSGESRLSNFLIWQAAYAEYWTTPILWPDFGPRQLRQAISDYSRRDRRFGGVSPGQPLDSEEFMGFRPTATDTNRERGRLGRSGGPEAGVPGDPRRGGDGVTAAPSSDGRNPFVVVQQAVTEVREGRFVLIVDDEDRENEGDLMIAAEHAGSDAINFLATHARGLICMPIVGSRLDELGIPLMSQRPPHGDGPAFAVSVDARDGVRSGISARDRARTVAAMIDPRTTPRDIVMPGHLFPLRYAEGGVLRRPGHTEASVDLAKLAGLYPAAVICEVMAPEGTMARRPQLRNFAGTHGICAITIQQIIDHRRSLEGALDNVTGHPLVRI